MLRGGALSRETEWKPTSDSYFNTHFKPVLEVLNPDTLGYDGLKAVYFDMGDLGMLGDSNGNLTSAGVVYTGALTLPEITPENGFILTREQAGKLGWFDGSNYYASCLLPVKQLILQTAPLSLKHTERLSGLYNRPELLKVIRTTALIPNPALPVLRSQPCFTATSG